MDRKHLIVIVFLKSVPVFPLFPQFSRMFRPHPKATPCRSGVVAPMIFAPMFQASQAGAW